MACDLVIGDETCAFAITPAKLGLPYNVGGIMNFLGRVPLNVAKEMFFTADPIPAERSERIGIVNLVVPAAELESRTYAMANTIATHSSQAIAVFKESMRVLSAAIAPSTYEYIQGLRRHSTSGRITRRESEKRPPRF